MSVIASADITLTHATFQQAGLEITPPTYPGVPLGMAYGFATASSTTAVAGNYNNWEFTLNGVSAYVYTLQDAWFALEGDAGSESATNAWLAASAGLYSHFPLYTDIEQQQRHADAGPIGAQQWGFEYSQVEFGVTRSRGIYQPVRSPNHPGNFPCAIGEAGRATNPKLHISTEQITSTIASNGYQYWVAFAYLYWAPPARLSALAYADLPVRGT